MRRFRSEEAKALLAGVGAHSMSLTAPLTSAFGTLLAMTAHAVGWPVVEGGSSAITDAHGGRARAARRDDRHRAVGRLAGGAPALDGGGARHVAQGPRRHRRSIASRPLPQGAPSISLRRGRVQDRLGAVRTGPLERRGLPPGRDRAPRRHVRRGGGQRVRRQRGKAPRPSLLHHRPGRGGRSQSGTGRPAGPVGLLPRPLRDRTWT